MTLQTQKYGRVPSQKSMAGNARLAGDLGLGLGAVEGRKAEPSPSEKNGKATPPHPPVNELVPEPCSEKVVEIRMKQQVLQ